MAAQQGAQPCQQLGQCEGLGQVVVGSLVEAVHAVLDRVPGGEHDHPGSGALVEADGPAHLEAVDVRQVEVEEDGVVWGVGDSVECGGAIESGVDGVALAAQPDGKGVDQIGFVFNNQHAHTGRLCQHPNKR